MDNVIRRMRFCCWITKDTDTPWHYVTFMAFPQQQWLRERALFLRYTRIVLSCRWRQTGSGAYPACNVMGSGVCSQGLLRPGRALHSHPLSAEIKNGWSCISTSPQAFFSCTGAALPFSCTKNGVRDGFPTAHWKPNSLFNAAVSKYQNLVCIVCIFPGLDESSVIAVVHNW